MKMIYDLIDKIRRRPTLYIGYASPTHLHSFLLGYYFSTKGEMTQNEIPSFGKFNDWVAKKFDYYESTSGWANMIENQREDKSEALYLFFELLDEFRGIEHTKIASVVFKHEDIVDKSWRGYSQLKKVRGTFETIPKPLPEELEIRKVDLGDVWYELVGKNKKGQILSITRADDLDRVYEAAKSDFGVEENEWKKENWS